MGAWIETQFRSLPDDVLLSHPMWVRGLKHPVRLNQYANSLSHPMWVRGLKPSRLADGVLELYVAPHVGAWIETVITSITIILMLRRTPCGCVD